MPSFVRGSSITFRATCKNAAGAPVTPTDAELSLSYANGSETIPMSIEGSVVTAAWDSSVALDSMPITWHIRAWNATDKVAQDGIFTLTASDANPTS